MLLKIIFIITVCISGWWLGNDYAVKVRKKIFLIEDYILFMQNFKSAVTYSSQNMYDFIKENNGDYTKEFCRFITNNKNESIAYAIDKYKCTNTDEQECVRIIKEAFIIAENSNDACCVAEVVDEKIRNLDNMKKQKEEEYRGKIKTAPAIFVITGLFAAMLVI